MNPAPPRPKPLVANDQTAHLLCCLLVLRQAGAINGKYFSPESISQVAKNVYGDKLMAVGLEKSEIPQMVEEAINVGKRADILSTKEGMVRIEPGFELRCERELVGKRVPREVFDLMYERKDEAVLAFASA